MPAAVAAADTAFVEETFQAVLALLEDARDHVAAGMAADVPTAERMRAAQELSRLTNRATAAMSLLLLAQALETGQDVGQEAGSARLAAQAAGILADIGVSAGGGPPAVEAGLATALSGLTARGEVLFTRMPRVHDLVCRLLAVP